MDGLSTRGERLLSDSPKAAYIEAHFERVNDLWDADTNPDGYIGMCLAENKLVWDMLEPKLTAPRAVPQAAVEYDSMIGSESFRSRLADFVGRTIFGRQISPDHVAALAGAGSVLEVLFYAIADPGDAVLVPTPSYTGFWSDLENRDELEIIPVHTKSADGFELGIDQLEAAYQAADRPVRALLFTSPSNPLGRVFARHHVEEVVAWAESKPDFHLVFDELFALSTFGDAPFTSIGDLRPTLGDRIHVVWAASKDLAASGLRCGVLVTESEPVMQAVDALAYLSSVSGDTQHIIGELVSDTTWVDGFIVENRRRLRDAYRQVTAALDEANIPYLPADAGFFFLVDMRRFMPEITWEAEHALWERMLTEANVNLSPGSALRVGEPGFMRLVYPCVTPEAAVAAVRRLGKLLGGSTAG